VCTVRQWGYEFRQHTRLWNVVYSDVLYTPVRLLSVCACVMLRGWFLTLRADSVSSVSWLVTVGQKTSYSLVETLLLQDVCLVKTQNAQHHSRQTGSQTTLSCLAKNAVTSSLETATSESSASFGMSTWTSLWRRATTARLVTYWSTTGTTPRPWLV